MANLVTILGSGTSTGIPIVGCKCKTCRSTDTKDKRFRASVLLTPESGKKILIDTTTDFRSQAIDNDIDDIDSVIITHEHADHLHGIDDLRPYCFQHSMKTIQIYADIRTKITLENRFQYIFNNKNYQLGGGIPHLKLHELTIDQNVIIDGEPFYFFRMPHGTITTLGFIHRGFGYVTDCKPIPDQAVKLLRDAKLDLLIIEAVREKPHETHLHLEMAFDYINQISPKQAGLIHMGHQLSHHYLDTVCHKRFNFPVFPLYDGQKLQYF